MAGEFGAERVLDIGCGTGTFACMLAAHGYEVTGLEPAGASLDVARRKAGAGRVRWVHGYVADLPPIQVDLVTMTANVAQVFLGDEEWAGVLAGAYAALRPGGRLVFETREPGVRAWLDWVPEKSRSSTVVEGFGEMESWYELLEVSGELVTFRGVLRFADGEVLESESTLRFRSRAEVTSSLEAAGFAVESVRDAPDRPGREMVFVARRPE
ncbi:class I SAM-dependent methyltransferase [Longispora albida]|uniref:class I SAM-dependent methyltransferase n=1 Tax=Longispora albida TaxID=203523 RepID=UPI000374AF33|nr:class I SAM-dependent methyltransferase [Longispora albida]